MSDMGDTPSPRSTTTPAGSQSPRAASSTAERATSPKKAAQTKGEGKVTKRRAARACASCRARKVRCDVVEGAPCGNCRWDDVPCIVQESRRRKKNLSYNVNCGPAAGGARAGSAEVLRSRSLSTAPPVNITANLAPSNGPFAVPLNGVNGDLYHNLAGGYGTAADAATAAPLSGEGPVTAGIPGALPGSLLPLLRSVLEQATELPAFIKPIPDKISPEDRQYLLQKQVFSLPPLPLQNALLKAYIEYVHPYMPLLELHDFLRVVNDRTGASGKVSLFLYHAVMFVATAFVDESLLKDSGYDSRRDARRTFFSRTRLIYDFDYETDRLIAVQGLLLMTYWYETPDDQKDTWYWMGDAISLAHTIGLHRNPAETPMIPRKQKLWKRVWWSCFMRDRLVALGMRRPTRIKAEDFDVPPLTVDDFEIEALPEENQLLDPDCALMRDVEMQRELAVLCIEKAKLCTFIGDVLRSQYSVLGRAGVRPEQTTTSTHMLLPNKNIENMDEVEKVDEHLRGWFEGLPECCQHQPLDSVSVTGANGPLAVQRNLLHMIYHTTVSALHRPLFLPASPVQGPSNSLEVQETARQRVREAAQHITGMVAEMRRHGLERYLPTTGVTVILPAMIIHLLDTKSPDTETRAKAIQGLRECLIVMSNLRNIYAAADFATGFLDALLRKGMLGGLPSQPPPPPPPILRAPAPGKTLHRTLAPAAISSSSSNSVLSPPPTALMPERPTTPPPDKANASVPPVLHPAYVAGGLYHASQLLVPGATTVRDADGDLVMGQTAADAATPPPTDGEDAATPSGSGGGDGVTGGLPSPSLLPMVGLADQNGGLEQYASAAAVAAAAAAAAAMMGHGHGHGQGDCMAAGNNFDFDQWLQFPAEGGPSTSDDTFMGGMFGGGGGGGGAGCGDPQTVMALGGDAAIDWLGGLGH